MCTCMCDWVTLLYGRKLTKHCKSAIMEKIKIIIKKKKSLLDEDDGRGNQTGCVRPRGHMLGLP